MIGKKNYLETTWQLFCWLPFILIRFSGHVLYLDFLVYYVYHSIYNCSSKTPFSEGWSWCHDVVMLWGACLCHLRSLCRGKCWTVATGGILRITVLWPVNAVPPPTYPIRKSYEISVFDTGSCINHHYPWGRWSHNDLFFEFWYVAEGYVDLLDLVGHIGLWMVTVFQTCLVGLFFCRVAIA